jgi:proteic killer suppression protein
MDFEFRDAHLEEVYYDPKASLGHGPAVDKGFRKVMGKIDAANDERDLRALHGLHYEKLKGDRSHRHSLKVTDQWRLIVERVKQGGTTKLQVISVEDYH